MLSFTTSAPPSSQAPDGRNGDLERTLWPLHAGVLALCGFSVLPPFVAPAVRWVDAARRAELLAAWAARLGGLEGDAPLFFHRLDDYDRTGRLKDGIEPATPGQHRGARFHLPPL
jgi:NAD(P)H dehydrogenase (quinone)